MLINILGLVKSLVIDSGEDIKDVSDAMDDAKDIKST